MTAPALGPSERRLDVAALVSESALKAYLDETVRSWIGLPAATTAATPCLPERLARLFLRLEEHENGQRDQFGCWEFGLSENYRAGKLWVPEVDEWAAEQRRVLADTVALEPLWPGKRPFALCLTHDVDRVSRQFSPAQAMRALRSAVAGSTPIRARARALRLARAVQALGSVARWGVSQRPSTVETLERCLSLETAHGVRGSYFFTAYPPLRRSHYDCVYALEDRCLFRGRRRRIAAVMREIANEGFDVGLHGSFYSGFLPEFLKAEKAMLEEAARLQVSTTRQHWLRWDIRVTPRLQHEAGFLVDATLGFNRNIGFRAGTSLPFFQFDLEAGRALELLEVPLVVQDVPLLSIHGLELPREVAIAVIEQLIDAVAAVGGVATLLFHPDNLVHPDFYALCRHAIEYGSDRGAWIASLKEIETWWRARSGRLHASAT